MNEQQPEGVPARSRRVITMCTDIDDALISVEHVYLPEGQAGKCCEGGCEGDAHDPGMVGLIMTGESEVTVSALLTAAEALTLANRLQRAAALVLESEEDVPDIEREAARLTAAPEGTAS